MRTAAFAIRTLVKKMRLRSMKKGLWWAQAGLALVLTLTIIGISVVGTLAFRPLYYHDVEALGIAEYSGYSEEEIRENYDALIETIMNV